MILTCPDCASRYFIDENKLGPQGRKVRCASCGASWRAEPEGETLDLAQAAVPPTPLLEAPPPPNAAEALPRSFRARAQARRRTRRAMAAGVVWSSLAAAFVILTLTAVVFRIQVVGLFPRTAGAYAALHLPVNPLGLSPENVQASPGLQDGHVVLMVKGTERNVEAAARLPADLRISLYDKAGSRLASEVVQVSGSALRPGEGRSFRAAFTDPPLAGVQVGVDFIFPQPLQPQRRAKAGVMSAEPHLRGPAAAPIEAALPIRVAQPLPAGSPYALPPAAIQSSGVRSAGVRASGVQASAPLAGPLHAG